MDFDFSDDQEQLRDAVRKWVDKGYTFERRRATVIIGKIAVKRRPIKLWPDIGFQHADDF